jgi:predicted HD superfamily hydrolase involved in NAD metabolism
MINDLIQINMLKLKESLSERRFLHSMRVMDVCEKLAVNYNVDVEKAKIAGLLHDCAREVSDEELKRMVDNELIETNEIELKQPMLLHAKASSIYAREKYSITDEEVLKAIACHTTGKCEMSYIDIIVYIADYIEPGRKFPGVDEVRNLAYNDIVKALTLAFKNTIIHVAVRGNMLHPETVNAYNWSLTKRGDKEDYGC